MLVVVMQRVSSFKDPPFDACKCPVPRAVLKHFLGDEVLLGQMRMPLMLPDQFKAILCADYVNHVDAGQGVYVLGAQQMCKSCYKWVRGLVSSEPLKQASLTVRRGWPIKRHGRVGMSGILSQKKVNALYWFLREVDLWGERMPGSNKSGKLYIPFYLDLYEMWRDYRDVCGEGAYDATGRLQILGARSFVDMVEGRGAGGQLCAHVQLTSPATFKKCGECETYKTRIGELRRLGCQFESQVVQDVVLSRRAHISIISSDRGLFQHARRLFQGPEGLITAEWAGVLLISADKSSDVFHPERYQQTDQVTKLSQLKGLLYGLMNHTTCENLAILSPASGVERSVRDDDAAKSRRKNAKKNGSGGESVAVPRARKGEAKMKVNVSWKGGTVFASFLLSYISRLQTTGAKLPPHLYLQIDGGERSFVLLCLCGYWLSIGTFEKVTIASHFPGHTHEAVDAMFSELRNALTANSKSGTLSWEQIVAIARKTYTMNTTAKHGPVHVVEPDCIFDLDKFFAGIRNPDTKGLWGDKKKQQTEKPHVFEMHVQIVGNVRVPEVRSYVCASQKSDDTLIRDWMRVFTPFATLPPPTDLPVADFHAPFERARQEMVRVMRSSPPGSLGLSEAQVQQYENLKLLPLNVNKTPFGITALPSHAIEERPVAVRLSRQGRAPAVQSSKAGRRKKRQFEEDFSGEDEESERGGDEADEEQEEEEEDKEEEEDDDDAADNSQIVELIELGGNGRVLVRFQDGSRKTVHRDALPDELENEYGKLVRKRQERNRASSKQVLAQVWHSNPGQAPKESTRSSKRTNKSSTYENWHKQ
jgi:hypothetical protein